MLIGYLKLPNKWASTASVENAPFIYRNCPPIQTNIVGNWGGIIKVDPWFNNYKLISQDGYKITEYWCVNLSDGVHNHLLVPVAMKKFGSGPFVANMFLFKNGIFDLLVETNRAIPNFNTAYIQTYSYTELLMECLSSDTGLFDNWSKVVRDLRTQGKFEVRFPSGTPFTMEALLQRCAQIDPFSKSNMLLLNEIGDLSDFGINTCRDLIDLFVQSLPINALNNQVDVDWIGECILTQNITNFTFENLTEACIKTSNSCNLMNILKEVTMREELIDIPNFTTNTIVEDYAITNFGDQNCTRIDSTYTDIAEEIDTLCSSFMLDEATTVALEYDIRIGGKPKIIDRVYGYGLASVEMFTNAEHANNVPDIEFTLHRLLECLNAWVIRCIKTYNEELFITITYNNEDVRSYYINLVAHACVSGCLFSS